jgi:LacI family transcriptional regulator, galactose operon repressor
MSDQGLPPKPIKPRATIRDVAALAGVGIKTVSRVINDEANVSPSTRERVRRAVRTLNFQPNLGAGSLRRSDGKSHTLGLLLDSVDNPFSAAVNRAVERVAIARNTAVFAASSEDDQERERALVAAFTRRRVDGLILTMIGADHSYLEAEREQGTPIIFVDRPPIGLLADAVLTDNFEAAFSATQHLIRHGHHRMAHLGDELTIATARERRRGFREALKSAGLPRAESQHTDNLRSAAEAFAAVQRLMRSPRAPTALFTSQNLVTVGAIRALHQLGLQHRVAMVGFDDLILADVLKPGITVIAQDPARIGTIAAERLFRRLDGDTSPEQTIIVPSRLIARGSGEIPPQG